jgi:hypothetical protein
MNRATGTKILGIAVEMLAVAHASMIPEIAAMVGREPTREFVAGMLAFSTSAEVENPEKAKDIFDMLEPKVWELLNKEDESAN